MAEETVKIRHAGFVYNKKHSTVSTDGKKITTWHPVMAARGELVKVSDMHEVDLDKGHEIGAFWTNDFHKETGVPKGFIGPDGQQFGDAEVVMTPDVPDMEETNEVELAEWVQSATVAQVVELAGTNPDYAARLLEAEEAASGRDPRKTLVDALEKIVG